MKIIQLAKFVATPQAWTENNPNPKQAIEQAAEVSICGIHLFSALPQSAAEAKRINDALENPEMDLD